MKLLIDVESCQILKNKEEDGWKHQKKWSEKG